MEANNTNKRPEQTKRTPPLESVMETAVNNMKSMVDANTVIGDPISTPDGTVVIPVSKISVGFVAGGSDFAAKNNPRLCFGGGSGSGITMTPISFLVISPSGSVNILPVNQNTVTAIDKIVERAPEVIEEIRNLFKKEN